MKTIKTNAIITGIRAKVDRSLGLTISTPELNNREKVAFMELQNINCNVLFEPLEEKAEILEVKGETETKTSSKRLRSVLYVWYTQLGKKEKFEDFYKNKMEHIIDLIKAKLE